jgi:hypothetical protein
LTYGVPKDNSERAIPVAHGGVLDKLRQISVNLANRYGWQEPQATLFVLSGNVPASSRVRSTVNFNRITLQIDPSITPRQLADCYRRVRRKFREKRTRALSPKHLYLATFPASCLGNSKWENRLDKWNEKYPDWEYDDLENFRRDCRHARKRLLTRAISIKRLLSSWQDVH